MNVLLKKGTVALALAALAVGAMAESWYWDPSTATTPSTGGVYTNGWGGSFAPGVNVSASTPFYSQNWFTFHGLSLPQLSTSVGVLFDPNFTSYNMIATNCDILGVWIMSVTKGTNTYTGATWVSSVQNPSNPLKLYDQLNLTGTAVNFAPGPGTLASANYAPSSTVGSFGTFDPSIDSLVVLPLIQQRNNGLLFGVNFIPVPEPSSIAALVTGGIGLLTIRRRRNA